MLAVALRNYLAGLGLTDSAAAQPTWYVGTMQDQRSTVTGEHGADFAVAVIPEPGAAPVNILGERPGIAIRVRHPLANEANLFIRKVFLKLQEFSSPNLAGSGIGVARITASQGPVQLGRDDGPGQGRWIVQQSYEVIVPRYDPYP